jgi:hypothetical protein
MNSTLRLALIVTIAATAFTAWRESQQENDIAPSAQGLPPAALSAPELRDSNPVVDLALMAPVDLFSHRPWLKTSPLPALPHCDSKGRNKKACAPAIEPVAPPLPFGLAGVWVEGPVRYVVLSAGNEQFLLCNQCSTQGATRVGGTVMGNYRLDSLDASQAVFTYLPLMQRQSLTLESL